MSEKSELASYVQGVIQSANELNPASVDAMSNDELLVLDKKLRTIRRTAKKARLQVKATMIANNIVEARKT